MFEWFRSGGVMMWPILLIGVGLLALTVRSLALARAGDPAVDSGLLSLLFWGGMAFVLGLLGTAVGLIQIGEVVSRLGAVNTATLGAGISVALITLVFGLLLALFALIAWYGVRAAARRTTAA